MQTAEFFTPEDGAYMIAMRRQIHQRPELGFDLPETVALVKRELEAMGVAYTEQYGKSSIVADLGFQGKRIALRADMDALPMEELTDLPFRSQIPGRMHSCGHDAHTAVLLGVARVLKRMEAQLPCRVRLLFQPSEECPESGAELMADLGCMEGVDEVLALHQDVGVPVGSIGLFSGDYMAACHPYHITFHGRSAHATNPLGGCDALAMAVKAYNDIQILKARQIGPFEQHILSVSTLHSGTAHNILPDSATMDISFRFFTMDLHDRIDARIRQICENAAAELGGTVEIAGRISAYPVRNDPALTQKLQLAAEKEIGSIVAVQPRMGSDDVSHFFRKAPGVLFRLGNRNPEKGCIHPSHDSRFLLDESCLEIGCRVFCRYLLEAN